MNKILCIASILFFLGVSACGIEDSSLSSVEKFTVDTLFSNQISSWRSEVDSLCKIQKDTLFVYLVDSLKKERVEEIENLLMTNENVQ